MKFDPCIVQTRVASPLGTLTLAATPCGLAGVWFDDQRHRPLALNPAPGESVAAWPWVDHHPVLLQAARQLLQYFAGHPEPFDLPLDLSGGTVFQQAVWQGLRRIPPGQTSSYSGLSQQLGRARAARAVGAAIGRNPLSIVVPCHRVVGARGSLVGYAGGLARKSALLALEALI